MTHYYLDTSAIMRVAEGLLPGQAARNDLIRPMVLSLLDDSANTVACSEVTLLEVQSNLTGNWRDHALAHYDEPWWTAATDEFFSLLEQKIEVLPLPVRAVARVMSVVEVGTRANLARGDKAMHAWDAFHLVIAMSWSQDVGSIVEFVTADTDFKDIIPALGLGKMISLLNLDVACGTGCGADKP